LYERTSSPLVLGGVGLAQVIPVILLSLPAGHLIDRYNRKTVVLLAEAVMALSIIALTLISYFQGSIFLIYLCLIVSGCSSSFAFPASSALTAQVVPEEAFEKATTWRSSGHQLSAVIGPTLSGFLIGIFHGATWVFVITTGAIGIYLVMLGMMKITQQQVRSSGEKKTWQSLAEGLAFLRKSQILLAAITLDLFAVLLGGAVTLLPIYARDILQVGPLGLGWLEAASSIGALSMTFLLAMRPPFKRAGRTLLLAVVGFGVATIVFGISQWFWLSLAMLFVIGALDSISVVIRSTLLLVRTPDEMRGRVGSVNSLFIGASNQLGGFESGFAAQFLGPVAAVAYGGIGTIVVVIMVAIFSPQMRGLTTLRAQEAEA
jgi:MFS family permease